MVLSDTNDLPFLEIPGSMIENMLTKTDEIGELIFNSIEEIQKKKDQFRHDIKDALHKESFSSPPNLSTCGIDGAYVVERLLGTDLLFSCALITEGLFPESKQQSNISDHEIFVHPERHDPENPLLARAMMLQLEVILAANNDYKINYLDGSLTTALIHMYKAINIVTSSNSFTSIKIKENYKKFLISYDKILSDNREDKIWTGIPKYTSRNDIGQKYGWPISYDDRAILTMILEPGEFTSPLQFTSDEGWHSILPYEDDSLRSLMNDVIFGIRNLYVLYYKPHQWSPAIRIEMPYHVAEDNSKLKMLLGNLKEQCGIPSILEPFPLYMADRIAKRISPAIPAYKQILVNKMMNRSLQNEDDILFMMHSYRTESGFN